MHVLRWLCVGHSTAQCGLRTAPVPYRHRDRARHALILSKSSRVAFWFPSPFPPCCSGLGSTDNPRRWVISVLVCLWAAGAATGPVPFDHSGFYPFAVMVLVACTEVVGWSLVGTCLCYQETVCSWWAMAVSPSELGVFPNVALRLPLVRVVTPYCLCDRSWKSHWVGLCVQMLCTRWRSA